MTTSWDLVNGTVTFKRPCTVAVTGCIARIADETERLPEAPDNAWTATGNLLCVRNCVSIGVRLVYVPIT
jgi:hypothetical protein